MPATQTAINISHLHHHVCVYIYMFDHLSRGKLYTAVTRCTCGNLRLHVQGIHRGSHTECSLPPNVKPNQNLLSKTYQINV